jgi:hypothetical protein
MRNKFIALVAALGIAFAVATPAKAQFWGPYYGGYGYGWGYGGWGYGAAAGLAIGAIAGAAIANQTYPYYGGGYYYEGYAPAVAAPRVYQKKQIIIRNSPGARVIEQDVFDW